MSSPDLINRLFCLDAIQTKSNAMIDKDDVIDALRRNNWNYNKWVPSYRMIKLKLLISRDKLDPLLDDLVEARVDQVNNGANMQTDKKVKDARDKISLAYLGDHPEIWAIKLDINKHLAHITDVIDKAIADVSGSDISEQKHYRS